MIVPYVKRIRRKTKISMAILVTYSLSQGNKKAPCGAGKRERIY
jgi:hypothetical protein